VTDQASFEGVRLDQLTNTKDARGTWCSRPEVSSEFAAVNAMKMKRSVVLHAAVDTRIGMYITR